MFLGLSPRTCDRNRPSNLCFFFFFPKAQEVVDQYKKNWQPQALVVLIPLICEERTIWRKSMEGNSRTVQAWAFALLEATKRDAVLPKLEEWLIELPHLDGLVWHRVSRVLTSGYLQSADKESTGSHWTSWGMKSDECSSKLGWGSAWWASVWIPWLTQCLWPSFDITDRELWAYFVMTMWGLLWDILVDGLHVCVTLGSSQNTI